MPNLLAQEDERESSEDKAGRVRADQLADLLANLKADSGNPDLWMEAATVYIALGRRRRASKAYRASVDAVHEKKSEEAALATIHRLLHGEDVPSVEPSAGPASDPTSGQEDSGRTASETFGAQAGQASLAEPAPSFASEGDALEQLRRELSSQMTVTCPRCNTLLEVAESWCPGCGQEMKEGGATLEERVGRARSALEANEEDPHALFTLAAQLAVRGRREEALEYLIRLTAIAPRYPGLWWVKARVFLDAGKPEAAQASFRMARRILAETGYGKGPLTS
ncbi:MAG: hypothetical protein ACE5JE_08185 [Thermoplasmata archaeon]